MASTRDSSLRACFGFMMAAIVICFSALEMSTDHVSTTQTIAPMFLQALNQNIIQFVGQDPIDVGLKLDNVDGLQTIGSLYAKTVLKPIVPFVIGAGEFLEVRRHAMSFDGVKHTGRCAPAGLVEGIF